MRRFLLILILLALAATASGGSPAPEGAGAGAAAPVEDFRPSARVPADEAVSFPVDI